MCNQFHSFSIVRETVMVTEKSVWTFSLQKTDESRQSCLPYDQIVTARHSFEKHTLNNQHALTVEPTNYLLNYSSVSELA